MFAPEVLGEALVVLTRKTAFIINLMLLILGPLIAFAIGAYAKIQGTLFLSRRGWIRFLVALIVASALVVGMTLLLTHFNPFVHTYLTYPSDALTDALF